jgi:outer membrane protein
MTEQTHRIRRAAPLVVLLALFTTAAAAADLKVAFVDMQRALNDSNAGKKAKGDFRSEIMRLQSKLERQQNEVQALKDELDKKGMLMREDERRNLQDDYTRKLRDFERAYKDSKDELQQKDNEITGSIIRDLAYVVRNVGERDGYTLVLEKGSLLWAPPSIDITNEVIREYNASASKIGSLGDRLNSGSGSSEIEPVHGGSQQDEDEPPPVSSASSSRKKSTISK